MGKAVMPVLQEQKPVMAARCCAGDFFSSLTEVTLASSFGVTCFRNRLFGANTPCNRVRLTLGLGTRAANLAMNSNGSRTMCVVPSR